MREREATGRLRGTIPEEVRRRLSAEESPDPAEVLPQPTPPSPEGETTPSAGQAISPKRKEKIRSLLLWVALPAAGVALAFALGAGLLAASLYAFLLLVLTARVMVAVWLRSLVCERELSADVLEIGDMLGVVTHLANPAPWPLLWIYAEESLPGRFARQGTTKRLLFLPPGRRFQLTYSMALTHRGCYQIGPLVYESGDIFGLFRRSRIDPRLDYVTVLPAYDVLDEFQPGRQRKLGDLAAIRSMFEDVTRLRGVREYRRGDPLNRIDWKSTARRGQLHSRVYDPILEAGATVILDFHRDAWSKSRGTREGLTAEEEGVELACTLCHYLLEGGWKAGLLSNGRDPLGLPGMSIAQARASDSLAGAMDAARAARHDTRLAPVSIPARRGIEQFPLLRENLGRIALSDGLPIEQVMLEELPRIERTQVLILITGELPDDLLTGVLRARELGYRVMVFLIGNQSDHDAALGALLGAGVEFFNMDATWRIREIATGRQSL